MTIPKILIVEDHQDWQEIYRRSLSHANYDITGARKTSTALALLEEQTFDVIITDLKMLGNEDDFSGFGVLETAKSINPSVHVIVITGYGSAERALRAMNSGAYDYITKDKDLRKKLALSVQSALEISQLYLEFTQGTLTDDVSIESDRIIGNSSSMQELFGQIDRAAQSDANVLLRGEVGTGKRLIAQTIHLQSRRKHGPFLVVDCGRLSDTVLESELFGYEAGVLSSTSAAQPGKFERTTNGTIFLDSIADLDVSLQSRLIGAICDRVVERIGGHASIPLTTRIIASTDKNLEAMLTSKQFERRIFDVLNEFVIQVPPLRDRRDGDDIPTLAAMFLQRHGKGRSIRFSTEAVALLQRYSYPGNVRELESAVKYALTVATDELIRPESLRPEIRQYTPVNQTQSKKEVKDPNTILKVCPLNLGGCSKQEEIIRLYGAPRVFVNVPDSPEYEPYEQVIRHTMERYSLVPILPKDHLEPVMMLCNICKLIQTCKYAVTDISFSDTDVLYRLGQMHATGVRCAILKDKRTRQSAELQGLFFLEYTGPDSLAAQLSRWIESQIREAKIATTDAVTDDSYTRDLYPKRLRGNRYNLSRIRILLTEGFSAEDLRRLCYDMPALRPVYDKLTEQTGKTVIVDRLVEHAEQHVLFEQLLAVIQIHNPTRFKQHEPYTASDIDY